MLKNQMKKIISLMLVVVVVFTTSLSNTELSNAFVEYDEGADLFSAGETVTDEEIAGIEEENDTAEANGAEDAAVNATTEEAPEASSEIQDTAALDAANTTDESGSEADGAEADEDLEILDNSDENITETNAELSDEAAGGNGVSADPGAEDILTDGTEADAAEGSDAAEAFSADEESAEAVPEAGDAAESGWTDTPDERMEFEYKDADITVTVELEKSALENAILQTIGTAGADEIEDTAAIPAAEDVTLSVTPITGEDVRYGDFISAINELTQTASSSETDAAKAGAAESDASNSDAAETEGIETDETNPDAKLGKVNLYDISFYTADGQKLRVDDCDAKVIFHISQSGVGQDFEIKVIHFDSQTEEELAELAELAMAGSFDMADLVETAGGSYKLEDTENVDYSLYNGELDSITFHAAGFSPYAIVLMNEESAASGEDENAADEAETDDTAADETGTDEIAAEEGTSDETAADEDAAGIIEENNEETEPEKDAAEAGDKEAEGNGEDANPEDKEEFAYSDAEISVTVEMKRSVLENAILEILGSTEADETENTAVLSAADGVRLSVAPITEADERYVDFVNAISDRADIALSVGSDTAESDTGSNLCKINLYDISFYTADGQKLNVDNCNAKVSIHMNQSGMKEESQIKVIYFAEQTEEFAEAGNGSAADIVETVGGTYRLEEIENIDHSVRDGELDSITFDATGFSPYAIVSVDETASVLAASVDNGEGDADSDASEDSSTDSDESTGNHEGTEINKFEISFDSGANKKVTDSSGKKEIEVWIAENKNSGHRFTFSVTYAASGTHEYDQKEFQIRIPKSILRNKSGASADYYEMSVPHEDEADEETKLVYKEDGDYIVVYNHLQLQAGTEGYFQVSYLTSEETFEYYDYEYKDENNNYTSSLPFYATINVRDEGAESNKLYVGIDTKAQINYTLKRTPTYHDSWDSTWGQAPADSDSYFYLVWEIQSSINANATQKYNFQLTDVLPEDPEGDLVAYKLQGNPYQSFAENTNSTIILTDQTLTGTRYDYVVTRHPKTVYAQLLEEKGKYTIKNNVTASVTSTDEMQTTTASSSASYSKPKPESPVFHPPVGSGFINKSGGVRKYELSVPKRGINSSGDAADRVEGLTYVVNAGGYPYGYGLNEGADTIKPESYGDKTVHYELTDNKICYGDYRLDKDDYEIAELSFSYELKDAEFNEEKKSFVTKDAVYAEDELFHIAVEYGDSWYVIGTFNPKPGDDYGFHAGDCFDQYVASYDPASRTFKFKTSTSGSDSDGEYIFSGITGYRITTDNKHYYTKITAQPSVTVKYNETLKEKIPVNATEAAFENEATLTISDPDAEESNLYYKKSAEGTDTLLEVQRTSHISKRVATSANHVKEKNYSITWKVAMWEKIENAQGTSYVNQSSGVFYDLLPEGSALDESSILVENEDGYLDSSAYEVEIHQNYKNSGRILLLVRIKDPGDYYNLVFDTIHSWESLKDYGVHVMNPAAYETGNEDIKNGYPDNGGTNELISNNTEGIAVNNKEWFTDLDPSTDDHKFLYAQTPFHIEAITSASTGLDKTVMGTEDTDYSYNTAVKPDGTYSYKLRYANSLSSRSYNSIIYDCMEQFEPIYKSEWKGKILSVDVSQLRDKGIEPAVYYSKSVGLTDLQDIKAADMDAEDGNIKYPDKLNVESETNNFWTKVESETNNPNLVVMPEDEEITAIAVDIRKDSNGNPFTLSEGGSVFVTINMQAPSSDNGPLVNENDKPYVHYPMTYNNVYIATTVISSSNTKKNNFIEQDYTSVKYHVVGNVYLTKVNTEDHEEKIGGITFRLYGTSDYGTPVDLFETTDRFGELVFKDVERGRYKLIEYSEDPDWLADHHERDVFIDGKGKVTVTYNAEKYEENTDDNPYLFGNKERIHTDVEFTKRELNHEAELLKGAKFKLTGISGYGNEITMYATSDGAGRVVFENLEYGSYTMTEVEAPDGYGKMNASFKVTVDESGEYRITLDSASIEKYKDYFKENEGEYRIFNENLNEFIIRKKDSWSHEELTGAEFHLYGTSFNGTAVDMKVETSNLNGAGTARFYGLEAGSYILVETKAPTAVDKDGKEKEYVLDETKRIVSIGTDGKITIDGTAYTEGTPYVINNTPKKGQLQVVKVWLDEYGDDNTKRSEDSLEIKLSTTQPEYVDQYAQFKSYDGRNGLFGESKLTNDIISFGRCPYSITEQTVKAMVEAGTAYVISPKLDKNYKGCEVYGWIENGHFYWWSKAATVEFAPGTERMFQSFKNLQTVDFNGTDTKEVTSFLHTFYDCTALTSVTGPIDTSSAKNMGGMFYNCTSLTEIESLKYFDTDQVTTFRQDNVSMFQKCSAIESLNLSSFDMSGATELQEMFRDCKNLVSINFGDNFNAVNVTKMQYMFSGCTSLTSVDTSGFHATGIAEMQYMFSGCTALTSVDCSGLGTSGAQEGCNASNMFDGCSNLYNLDLSSFDTSQINNMYYMFNNCDALVTLDLSNFQTPDVTTMQNMFSNCNLLETIIFGNDFDTSAVTNMFGMFYNCPKLQNIDLTGFNTSNVTNMQQMFAGCGSLMEIDVHSFDTSKVTQVVSMFDNCNQLKTIYADNSEKCFGNISNSSTYASTVLFSNCPKLEGGNGAKVNNKRERTVAAYARIDGQDAKEGYFTHYSKKPALTTSDSGSNTAAETVSYSVSSQPAFSPNVESAGTATAAVQAVDTDGFSDDGFSSGDSDTDEFDDEPSDSTTDTSVVLSTKVNKDSYTLTKEGNVWTYTFQVDDSVWYAWEDIIPVGYEIVEVDGKKDGDKTHPLEVSEGGIVTITNKLKTQEYVPPAYGSLTLNKKVYGIDEEQILNSGTQYEFTVTLTDENEAALEGTAIYGDTVFTNGVATVFLTSGSSEAGDTITFTDIPSGYHFTVSEKAIEGVTTTCEVTDKTEPSVAGTEIARGVIDNEQNANVSYKNVITPVETQDFFIEKKVTGLGGGDAEYVMDVALTGLEKNTKYYIRKASAPSNSDEGVPAQPEYQDYMWFLTDETGDADVSIKLKQDERVKFEAVPVGSTYQITEEADLAYRASFTVTDENTESHGQILTSYGGNANTNTSLSTAKETVDAGEEVTVTFTNEIIKNQKLKLIKAMDSPVAYDEDAEYEFTIRFSGLTDGYTVKSSIGVMTADYTGTVEKTFKLKPGEEVLFSDIPVGATYHITELDAGKYISSYTVVDSATGQQIVAPGVNTDSSNNLYTALEAARNQAKAAYNKCLEEAGNDTENDNVKEAKQKLDEAQNAFEEARKFSTKENTIGMNTDSVVTFTNILPTANLSVSKQVTGSFGDKTKQFTFTASDFVYEGEPLKSLPDHTYTVVRTYADGTKEDGTVVFNNGEASFTISGGSGNKFTIGHSETLTIQGLPIGTTFKITEENGQIQDYTVTNTITPAEAASASADDSAASGKVNGAVASGTIVKDGTSVVYTNEKEGVVPTGLPDSDLILLLLIGFNAMLMTVFLLKCRNRYENES